MLSPPTDVHGSGRLDWRVSRVGSCRDFYKLRPVGPSREFWKFMFSALQMLLFYKMKSVLKIVFCCLSHTLLAHVILQDFTF